MAGVCRPVLGLAGAFGNEIGRFFNPACCVEGDGEIRLHRRGRVGGWGLLVCVQWGWRQLEVQEVGFFEGDVAASQGVGAEVRDEVLCGCGVEEVVE
jgi:hypothetical protein